MSNLNQNNNIFNNQMTAGELKKFFGYKVNTRYRTIASDLNLPVNTSKYLIIKQLQENKDRNQRILASSRIVRSARNKILFQNPVFNRTFQTGNNFKGYNVGRFTTGDNFKINIEKYRRYVEGQRVSFVVIQDGVEKSSGAYKFFDEAVDDLIDFLQDQWENYAEDDGGIIRIQLAVLTPNVSMIGMGAARSHNQATKKWFVYSPNSRINCLYHAVQVGLKPEKIDDYINDNHSLSVISSMFKKRIDPSNILYGDDVVLQQICNHIKTEIIVYDNLYRDEKTFIPKKYPTRKQRKPIELRICRNHFETLIRWSDIPKHLIDIIKTRTETRKRKLEEEIEELKALPIKKFKKRKTKFTDIGAWDIETYCTPDKKFNTYAIGIAYNDEYHSFWGEDSIEQYLQHLHDNSSKLDGFHFYAHNGGKFDSINIQKKIMESKIWKIDTQINDMIELDGRILKLCIYNDEGHCIHFRDSVAMLSGSLDKLCKSFKISNQKGKEDHEAIEKFLNNHYSIDGLKNAFPTLDEYLKLDCKCLLEIVLKFNDIVHEISSVDAYGSSKKGSIRLVDCLTAASLSKNLFYQKYYYGNVYFLTDEQDEFIRDSYGGGRTEAFHIGKVEKKLWYYDFTSLYPSVCVNKLPVGKPEYVPKFNRVSDYSFIKCMVRSTENGYNHKPLHYIKKEGKMIFPYFDTWTELTLYSEEIKYGLKHNLYEYQLLDGYKFQGGYLLKEFMKSGFDKKATAKQNGDKALAQTWKIIINSGYGFWGLKSKNRDSVKLINDPDFNPSRSYQYIEQDKLVNESYYKDYTMLRVKADIPVKDFNVSVCSAISSLARLKITELIHDIERKGDKVYYCDTDSVITDCDVYHEKEIQEKFMWDFTGDELGSLKNEAHDLVGKEQQDRCNGSVWFDKLYCFGSKYYALQGENMEICKLKGYKQSDTDILTISDYENIDDKVISQDQMQFLCPKTSWLDETNPFQMVKHIVKGKTFKVNYLKGDVGSDGNVSPFVY